MQYLYGERMPHQDINWNVHQFAQYIRSDNGITGILKSSDCKLFFCKIKRLWTQTKGCPSKKEALEEQSWLLQNPMQNITTRRREISGRTTPSDVI